VLRGQIIRVGKKATDCECHGFVIACAGSYGQSCSQK